MIIQLAKCNSARHHHYCHSDHYHHSSNHHYNASASMFILLDAKILVFEHSKYSHNYNDSIIMIIIVIIKTISNAYHLHLIEVIPTAYKKIYFCFVI